MTKIGRKLLWLAGAGMVAVGIRRYAAQQARRAEEHFPPEGAFVTIDGVRVHYVRRGQGPTIVLLHGSDGTWHDFQPVLNRLAVNFDVIALDRPGHGDSGLPNNESATPGVQLRLLRAVLQQLNVSQPLLVGHSWGGLLAALYALEYPNETAGLVLLAPWLYPPRRPVSPLLLLPQLPMIGEMLASILLPPVKPLLVRHFLAQAFAPFPVPRAYERRARAVWQRHPRQIVTFAQENTTDRAVLRGLSPDYSRLQIPVVIVTGDMDRSVPPKEHALRLHESLPQSQLILIPNRGHALVQTSPEALTEAIRQCAQAAQTVDALYLSGKVETRKTVGAESDFERARMLVMRYGWNATAYQILNPGMEHWFAPDGEAVVGFVRRSGTRVAAGAPVCAEPYVREIAAEFEASARRQGETVCWFGAGARLRSALLDQPDHAALVIGAQPVWNPVGWTTVLAQNRSLRAQVNRAGNKGVVVTEWPKSQAANHPGLQNCLEEWLASHSFPTLHFLTEPVTLDRLADRRIFVAEQTTEARADKASARPTQAVKRERRDKAEFEGTPVGFAIAAPIPDRNGWLIEQIVRGNAAPNGTAERMIDCVMRTLAGEGTDYVTLGLAPLSRRVPFAAADPPRPWLRLALAWVRAHGRRFYNFEGLDAFKAKLKPDGWEPIFAISNERWVSPRTLYALAAAFSNGPPIIALARAAGTAAWQELAWLRERRLRRARSA